MTHLETFALPDVGEGLTEAEIIGWRVAPGDDVTLNQILVEIETAKAAVELPSPYAGRVSSLLAEVGATLAVGAPLITIDTDPTGAEPATGSQTAGPAASAVPTVPAAEDVGTKIGEMTADGKIATLVGYVSTHAATTRRPRKAVPGEGSVGGSSVAPPASAPPPTAPPATAPPTASPPTASPAPSAPVQPVPAPGAYSPAYDSALGLAASVGPSGSTVPLASPPVRKLAKDLGVDLTAVVPSGEGGVITRADVQQAGTSAATAPPDTTTGAPPATAVPAAASGPASSPGGGVDLARERRVPIRGVRKATAAAMVTSATTAPQVTVFLTVDVTEMMALRQRLRSRREFGDVKITPLTFAARAVCKAIQRTPDINAWWDERSQEIVFKDYVNLGIAAATPRGLVVPNIKDADRLDLYALAQALTALTETARTGRTALSDMTGGTFTISNIGVLGVDTGTPLINPGETAILALGSIKPAPWVVDGELAVRQVCQLALTFDHRVVDGEQGSRFLADVGALMTEPGLALAW